MNARPRSAVVAGLSGAASAEMVLIHFGRIYA